MAMWLCKPPDAFPDLDQAPSSRASAAALGASDQPDGKTKQGDGKEAFASSAFAEAAGATAAAQGGEGAPGAGDAKSEGDEVCTGSPAKGSKSNFGDQVAPSNSHRVKVTQKLIELLNRAGSHNPKICKWGYIFRSSSWL